MPSGHPHSAHGNSSATKIEKLLAFHESAAAAIRLTIELMNGQAKTAKTNGHSTVLAEAVALDGARAVKSRKSKKKASSRADILAQRERTAKVLDAFDVKRPRSAAEVQQALGIDSRTMGIAPLLHHRYLKKKRGGLVRTAKTYVLDPYAKPAE